MARYKEAQVKELEQRKTLLHIPESRLPGISALPIELWSVILETIIVAGINYRERPPFLTVGEEPIWYRECLGFPIRLVCRKSSSPIVQKISELTNQGVFDKEVLHALHKHLAIRSFPYKNFTVGGRKRTVLNHDAITPSTTTFSPRRYTTPPCSHRLPGDCPCSTRGAQFRHSHHQLHLLRPGYRPSSVPSPCAGSDAQVCQCRFDVATLPGISFREPRQDWGEELAHVHQSVEDGRAVGNLLGGDATG